MVVIDVSRNVTATIAAESEIEMQDNKISVSNTVFQSYTLGTTPNGLILMFNLTLFTFPELRWSTRRDATKFYQSTLR